MLHLDEAGDTAGNADLSSCRLRDPAERLKQGAFARAVSPYETYDVAPRDVEVNVSQRPNLFGLRLLERVEEFAEEARQSPLSVRFQCLIR